jgi:hypothetical protein
MVRRSDARRILQRGGVRCAPCSVTGAAGTGRLRPCIMRGATCTASFPRCIVRSRRCIVPARPAASCYRNASCVRGVRRALSTGHSVLTGGHSSPAAVLHALPGVPWPRPPRTLSLERGASRRFARGSRVDGRHRQLIDMRSRLSVVQFRLRVAHRIGLVGRACHTVNEFRTADADATSRSQRPLLYRPIFRGRAQQAVFAGRKDRAARQ